MTTKLISYLRMGVGWSQKLPHNYEAIIKDADTQIKEFSSVEQLYEQLYAGVFLNKNQKKYWIPKGTHYNCFMLYARNLTITWADDKRFWHWPCVKEMSVIIDVAEMLNVCWLEIQTKFSTANLSPGIMYEVLFVVMLKDPAYGWESPVNLRLSLQNQIIQEHKENFMEKPRGRWIEIPIGEFMVNKVEELEVYIYEYEHGIWKRGLVIKGIIIRPK